MRIGRHCFLSTVVVCLLCPFGFLTRTVLASRSSRREKFAGTPQPLVIGVDGGTESIRACCFDANGKVVGQSCAVPYTTRHPHPGWAEQDPEDWYNCLGQAVRGALQSVRELEDLFDIKAICVDTTCCSVVALNEHNEPLMPCLLWMDQRSALQASAILETCQGDPALNVNCHGHGPLSAEWMTPKALWIHDTKPSIWKSSKTICEYQDYINYKLTGVMCASSCNAATRWHWNGEECIKHPSNDNPHPGRPVSLYTSLGIPELADKLPQRCLPMGTIIGRTTRDATEQLGLSKPITVVQGGADAFVGMVGLGCVEPGQLCLITGSSHLHCVVTSHPSTAPGTWGAYRGAPLAGMNFAEGGQSSTGSLLRWARTSIFGVPNNVSYADLDREAEAVEPGANGLVALETFQGSRTPVTDPFARGAFIGLTLAHSRAHVWRALMEAVCFGTRACIDALAAAGHDCSEIVIAGGATRSPLWLQMHADVTGRPVVVCENADAPLLGCAILACVGVGLHDSVQQAVASMVRIARRVEPDKATTMEYDDLYENIYSNVLESVRPVVHAIQDTQRPGSIKKTVEISGGMTKMKVRPQVNDLRLVGDSHNTPGVGLESESGAAEPIRKVDQSPIVSPSLLACDWARIQAEVFRCLKAKAGRLHVDVFDGVFLDSPMALTFGPQMVAAIRKSCDRAGDDTSAVLDLHMCVVRPQRYVAPMAEAGGDRFVFQWEAMDDAESAIELALEIRTAGMACGVSLDPATPVEEIFSLLATNLVDLVDVLAVDPGFGGQTFQRRVLDKIRKLKEWKEENNADFDIMVDGGVNEETAEEILAAGANILVSGSYLFQHQGGMKQAIRKLLKNQRGSDQ